MQVHSAFYWEIKGNSDIQEFSDIKTFTYDSSQQTLLAESLKTLLAE